MSEIKREIMQTVNLKRIMDLANLKSSYLGAHLFPENKSPRHAIHRVLKGDMLLNSWQIAKLSELINVPVGLLFEDADWQMAVPVNTRLVQFRTYDYFAELDLDTMTTTISRNGVLFFEKTSHEKSVEISEYLSSLTDLVIKNR